MPPGGDHDDANVVVAADTAAEGQAILPRQHDVQHRQVYGMRPQMRVRRRRVRRPVDLETAVGQMAHHQGRQPVIVFHQQDTGAVGRERDHGGGTFDSDVCTPDDNVKRRPRDIVAILRPKQPACWSGLAFSPIIQGVNQTCLPKSPRPVDPETPGPSGGKA
ncbi:hypothetical protein AZA_90079 [Nitrospirillum viridazoti Y2]|nr:hypothetical protein AZA_90079 [Nitrospirillum amazonense Y2]